MKSFLKIFLASFLALLVFTLILFFMTLGFFGGLVSKTGPIVEAKSVLVLDLSQHFAEQELTEPFAGLGLEDEKNTPGLYDVLRLIHKAASDENIRGIYLVANNNANGFESSDEIRNALKDFKKRGKFIIAYGDVITQKAYEVANIADKLYANPIGYVEWKGFNAEYVFLKGTLDKLEIQPQIFYAGKFKSATEPFRTDKMTPENKLQTTAWLSDIYNDFLIKTSESRKIDTAVLHQLANDGRIQSAKDAYDNKLVDGLKYDDEVKDVIKEKLGLGKFDKINFVTINKYAASGNYKKITGEKIALIYAEGDIVDGKGDQGRIGSDDYIKLIRKARLDKTIKAIVFRINSGGGSSLASENIWRELSLAKQEKPVVVSFGDVAASGGYYVSCGADSIFANPNTITGSIGVFGIIPNMEQFFKNKLGVTFDGVKTAPHADAGNIYRPLNDFEKKIMQSEIENIYLQFKQRVADGRKRDTSYIEGIAQGRVWTGKRAIEIGLVDRFGGIQDAIDCAARMAKLTDYRLKEFPEPKNIFERLFGSRDGFSQNSIIEKEIGKENFEIYKEMQQVKQMTNTVQTRLPFRFFIH